VFHQAGDSGANGGRFQAKAAVPEGKTLLGHPNASQLSFARFPGSAAGNRGRLCCETVDEVFNN